MIILLAVAHVLGVLSTLDALKHGRTPQGSVAWVVSLNLMPLVAVPAYWVLGRTRFHGYVSLRQDLDAQHGEDLERLQERVRPFVHAFEGDTPAVMAGSNLAELPYLTGNALELLVDGEATFESVFAGIREAREYVLLQFYILRDDSLGRELADLLVERARAGVRVHFLYDELGTTDLSDGFRERLGAAGVELRAFHTTRGSGNRLQLNFRNHRKIVVVDGRAGWLGGHNVGDEYVGRDPEFPAWRDTHLRLDGPAVLELQLSFVEDWRWATDTTPELAWEPHPAPDGSNAVVLVLPSGPADRLETASLMYQQAIHAARRRIWIATPYFVPDEGVLAALHLACLRGVEVRVLIPEKPDSRLVGYSVYSFLGGLIESGVQVHQYTQGFLHQKVFLVDDDTAGVGTANLDNRSFRLNFEVTALVLDHDFAGRVERMLDRDFERSRRMTLADVTDRPWWFLALSRAAYLFTPLQ